MLIFVTGVLGLNILSKHLWGRWGEGGREREKWHWYRRNEKNCIIFFVLILQTLFHLWYEEQSILFCSYTESGFVYSRVFQTNGLMRTRLNPDATKMIICTTGGYLIIIHNLDLTTMAQDLAGFKVICVRSSFANFLVIFELHYYVLRWVICIIPSLIKGKTTDSFVD